MNFYKILPYCKHIYVENFWNYLYTRHVKFGRKFLLILLGVLLGMGEMPAAQRTRKIQPKDQSSDILDRTFYLRARTFFVNGDINEARTAIDKHLARYPTDQQARTLSDLIAEQFKNLENRDRINTRTELLNDVQHAWEVSTEGSDDEAERPVISGLVGDLENKLARIIIPRVRFINLPISSAVETIAELSVQYDYTTNKDEEKGVNIVLVTPPGEEEPKINLNLRNIPLERLLCYVSQAANYRCDYAPDAVIIGAPHMIQEQLSTHFFGLSRATIIKLTGLNSKPKVSKLQTGEQANVFDEEQAIKNFLIRAGVDFGVPGSNLAFDGAQLIVTNNLSNLRRLEAILQKYSEAKQVEIEAKFLEVTQGTLDELAFRWNVNNINHPARGVISTGQTTNDGVVIDNLRTVGQAFPASRSTTGDGKIITNNKSETFSNQPPQLSGQINLGMSSVPLGSFLGVIDRAQIGMMIRALEQTNGSDLMSAPKLTVLSGRTANIVVAQELKYPQKYGDAHSDVGVASTFNSASSAGVTVTSGTPQDFTTRNIGVEMKVTPIVEDGDNISLQLEPTVTEFEGFMEYGGPSLAISGGATVTVPSGFYQPIFSTRAIQTEVTVQNGATVVMGGLTREEVKEVHDKVPVLGNIPLLGKLFRSKSETTQKRNLLIFVTARTVSPNGTRFRPAIKHGNFDKIFEHSAR